MRLPSVITPALMLLLPCHAGQAGPAVAPVCITGKVGYIDTSGGVVIPPSFNRGGFYSEGLAAVQVEDLWGYIDREGGFRVSPRFADARDFREGKAAVRPVGEACWGFAGRDGEIAITARFDAVGDFSEGLACVGVGGRWGYVDHTGRLAIPVAFDLARPFSEGRAIAIAASGGRSISVLLSASGEHVHELEETDGAFVGGVRDGLVAVVRGGLWGYADANGRSVIAPDFTIAHTFCSGLAAVRDRNGKYGYVGYSGEFVIPAAFSGAGTFEKGLAPVLLDGRYGFINTSGRLVIPAKFENVYQFNDGLAEVMIDGVWDNYIDRTGRVVWTARETCRHGEARAAAAAWFGKMMDETFGNDQTVRPEAGE